MKRAQLQAGEVSCAECGHPMLAAAAAVVNGQAVHPVGCFPLFMVRWGDEVITRLEQHLGGVELSISIGKLTAELGRELTRELTKALKRPRPRPRQFAELDQ